MSIAEIDASLGRIDDVTWSKSTTSSFLLAQQQNESNNSIVLGASFNSGFGGKIINNTNYDEVLGSNLSAAATINKEFLADVISLNMLIIDNPSIYRNIDNSTHKTLASSIIIATVKRKNTTSTAMSISLYFQVFSDYKPNITDVDYYCSFYNTTASQWSESGCTTPLYNTNYKRYECSCNHLTSFALIWLPKVPLTRYLDAQDIASLVFQSISILCFLAVIIHALFTRFYTSSATLQAYDLLPLISSASTTILFIFYIALGMTVYTHTTSLDQTQCFLSSTVLMFFVYFFVIFMFCTKTSVGYFNYLRFVHLFPQPSHRKLLSMLLISFFISITWVAFAAGFNSNPSFHITQLYPYKLCWFTRNVLHYFFTIPVCLFLLINLILFILTAHRIINHVLHATSPHQSYERMKRCVLVLLSSCLTQGIGWLFGPILTFVDPTAGVVLGCFFVVFNGLEGLWSIILYIIIRSQHMDERRRVLASKELAKTTSSRLRSRESRSGDSDGSLTRRSRMTNGDSRRKRNDLDNLFNISNEEGTVSGC